MGENKQELNRGHFHEIADRIHIVNCNIDDNIIGHPGMTERMTKLCKEAQQILCMVMNEAWGEADRLFPDKA